MKVAFGKPISIKGEVSYFSALIGLPATEIKEILAMTSSVAEIQSWFETKEVGRGSHELT